MHNMFYRLIVCGLISSVALFSATAQESIPPGFQQLPAFDPPPTVMPPNLTTPAPEPAATPASEPVVIHPWYYYKAWGGAFDLGANGSDGNSQNFNLRLGLNAKREVPWSITTLRADYVNNSADSNQTADRLFFDGRYEWLFQGSPWSIYVHNTEEYDQFRAFDLRVTFDAGVGYQFWKSDISSFKGRFVPVCRENFGGPNDEWTPELVFGAIYERQISKKQKFNVTIDYFPQVEDVTNYRVNTAINWEVVLDEVNNLSLKVGIIDRYDSTPEGKRPNDIDYKTVLVYSF